MNWLWRWLKYRWALHREADWIYRCDILGSFYVGSDDGRWARKAIAEAKQRLRKEYAL